MPSIHRLYEKLEQEDIAFLLISEETEGTVQEFVQEKGWDFPIYLISEDVPPMFKVQGIPVTFILDRQGKVVFKHVGSARWDDDSSIRFLKNLLEKSKVQDSKTHLERADLVWYPKE